MESNASTSEAVTIPLPSAGDIVSNSEHFKTVPQGSDHIILGIPGDALASCGGAGTLEILEATKIFESANIPCCLVGVSALKYFGAWRVRDDWEICVPTDIVERASAILKSEPYNHIYEICQPGPIQLQSLLHTFPRFKLRGVSLWFDIVPSQDYHLDCESSKTERSQTGLPYPKLGIFAQSLLDTYNLVSLTDLVDGMNLTEEWGLQHLNLRGTNDVAWAKQKNKKIRLSVPLTEDSCLFELSAPPFSLRETWERIVRGKDHRIGIECPKEIYVTRVRFRNDEDPRLRHRDDV